MTIGNRPVSTVRRGDVFDVDFGVPRGSEQAGRRPAVVISTDDLNEVSSIVIVAAITSRSPSADRPRPQQVAITARESGLARNGLIKLDQVLTVARTRLLTRRGRLSPLLMREMDDAIFYVMGLDDREP
jgi:mRNA interferase MazF